MSSFNISQVGDMFRPHHWPGPGLNTKCSSWHFCLPDSMRGRRESPHKIVLRHCTATGNWVLFVDGRYEMHGYEPIHTPDFEIAFKLGSNEVAIKVNRTKNLVTHHRLLINSNEILSFETQPANSLSETPPQKIFIKNYDIRNEDGKAVAFFEITTVAADGSEAKISRRYSEFTMLSSALYCYFYYSHLLNSLPSLPGKVYNPFTKQLTPEFLEDRRHCLEVYLNMLLGNEKVVCYTDFLCFVGLNPITGSPL